LHTIDFAKPEDRSTVERLIAAYHASEGVRPNPERIRWAVDRQLQGLFPGLFLVARQEKALVGVVLAIFTPSAELGRVLTVNDFYVNPAARGQGIGRALVQRLIQEAEKMKVDEVDLEVLPENKGAAAFWTAMGFVSKGRTVYARVI
jgi:ribosomal protein S18 acetylase RimI-like enzyme